MGYAQDGGGGVNEIQLNITRIIFNNFVTNEIYQRILKSAMGRQGSAEQCVMSLT